MADIGFFLRCWPVPSTPLLDLSTNQVFVLGQPVSNLVFYAQSTRAVLSGRFDNQKFGEKHGKVVLNNVVCPWFMCFLWGLDH